MHRFVSHNLAVKLLSEAGLLAISSAALYGKGVFTTIPIRNSKPFLWDKHWRRISENADAVSIDLSGIDKISVQKSLEELIAANRAENSRARITFFDNSESLIWSSDSLKQTSVLIQTGDLRKLPKTFRLTTSPFSLNSCSPLANIKSCNYLENLLAFDIAKELGFDEAIRLNELSEVSSASMANIFWIIGNGLFTPALETGCLAGTIRELILETAPTLGFDVFETHESIKNLEFADEAFLTSSGLSIKPVSSIDNWNYQINSTEILRKAIEDQW